MKAWAWIGAAIVIIVVGAAFLFQGRREKPVEVVPETVEQPTRETPTVAPVTFEVSGDEFSFSPATLTAKRGVKVRLIFKNSGTVPHTWTIDELRVDTGRLSPGQSKTIEFVAERSATFTSYCTVPGHRERGMVGTLVVEEN